MRLDPARTQVLLVDFQERLFGAMPEGTREQALKAAENILFIADALSIPVTVTEQYPQGIGQTMPSLRRPAPFQKLAFSAMAEPGFSLEKARREVLVMGMEAHICVAMTVRDLREAGFKVAVIADACLSRRESDRDRGLAWCQQEGAAILPSETVGFGLLGRATGPNFKEFSRRIR